MQPCSSLLALVVEVRLADACCTRVCAVCRGIPLEIWFEKAPNTGTHKDCRCTIITAMDLDREHGLIR